MLGFHRLSFSCKISLHFLKPNNHSDLFYYKCVCVCARACVRVCILFNMVIQYQTASQIKTTRHPVFYMLIRTHEA